MKLSHFLAKSLLCASFALSPMLAHAEWNDSIRYKAEIGINTAAGDHNPFWFVSNRFGMSSIDKQNGYLRLSAFKDLDRNKRFSWGAGVDLGVGYGFSSVFLPQQLYAEVKYRCLDAMIGQKEITDGFLNDRLSSGALTYSNNARPIPQLRVGIFDYANVWGCQDMFAIKGYIAYGLFTEDWWVKRHHGDYNYSLNALYCSRAIYFRGGNPDKFPLVGELGLEMATQFGGRSYFYDPNTGTYREEKHPKYAKAWLKALIPMKGGDDTSVGEQANVEGNMLGNWALSLRWEDPSGWMVKAYYEHFFEDHSMLFFDYPWKDGLYGVEARLPKNPFVSEILYEFLYMKDQAGPVYWDHIPSLDVQISGRDDYYNHYIYNGWEHWGMGIGNPLLISPIYNSDHHLYFYHTRVRAHHLGLTGDPTPQVSWRMLATYNQSWGTYDEPLKKVESDFSLLAEVKWHPRRLKGWEGSISFAFDAGSLLGHSYGAMLTISKTGFFK